MRLFALVLALFVASCAHARAERPAELLVAAANPHASSAGLEVLKRGGSAVDAAVAVQATLSLVEPQSSGLGGGAFMMVYDAQTRTVRVYDGRETAPSGASPDMFLGADGKPLPFAEAVVSGRATGAPGVVAMLAAAHEDFGKLRWSTLFEGPARLAETGFAVSPRLGGFLRGAFPQNAQPDVKAYFSGADGAPLAVGETLRNPTYAATLRTLAEQGPRAFYEGPIADAIVSRVQSEPLPGTLTKTDLAVYRAIEREPLCRPFRVWIVCAPPPPSSGAAVLQALMLIEAAGDGPGDPDSAEAWWTYVEALRLMYADRDRYVGDPAFVDVPVEGLLDPEYVAARADLIGDASGPAPQPGSPEGAGERAPDRTVEPEGTSHFVIVDAEGDVVSMTTSVESIFGTGRMAGGFFLNNQLTDFSFSPTERDGAPAANAAAPGKRPRSSMSPVIVLDRQGRFVAALGSPGGSNILAYNVKTLLGVLDWGLAMQQAIELPNVNGRGADYFGEADKLPPAVREALAARGAVVRSGRGEGSGIQGVIVRDGRLDAGADPRREGMVARAPAQAVP